MLVSLFSSVDLLQFSLDLSETPSVNPSVNPSLPSFALGEVSLMLIVDLLLQLSVVLSL